MQADDVKPATRNPGRSSDEIEKTLLMQSVTNAAGLVKDLAQAYIRLFLMPARHDRNHLADCAASAPRIVAKALASGQLNPVVITKSWQSRTSARRRRTLVVEAPAGARR